MRTNVNLNQQRIGYSKNLKVNSKYIMILNSLKEKQNFRPQELTSSVVLKYKNERKYFVLKKWQRKGQNNIAFIK
jgi:hypothetical protein